MCVSNEKIYQEEIDIYESEHSFSNLDEEKQSFSYLCGKIKQELCCVLGTTFWSCC